MWVIGLESHTMKNNSLPGSSTLAPGVGNTTEWIMVFNVSQHAADP